VQLADWLSSAEREENEDQKIPYLQSIFSRINNYNHSEYVALSRLNPLDEYSLFPRSQHDMEWKNTNQQDYKKHWDNFKKAYNDTRRLGEIKNPLNYLENFYALLQDYAWCIPSGYWKNVPDVSLFDHARTTAALAACLAADDRSIEWCKTIQKENGTVCLLLGGDLSGVQSFIYNIASSGAAKSLRARSFYVQMITETLALAIIQALQIPITNIIYVGGGGFQILVPVCARENLPQIVRDLTDRLLVVHQGGLGLTVRWVEIQYNDFEYFNKVRERLGKDINLAKRKPFSGASPDKLLQVVGQPLNVGGDPLKYCSVTGEDGENIEKDRDGEYKSKFVISLESLGNELPKATHIITNSIPMTNPCHASHWKDALRSFGLDIQIYSDKTEQIIASENENLMRIWKLNPNNADDRLSDMLKDRSYVITYRPFAQLTPLDEQNRPKTFDDLSKPKTGSFERWGVLRMDVDNLGKLFREGFGENTSLSRIASLSFALRLFFEGWLPKLAEPDLTEYLYLQYAGGDDLFIVGSWDTLPIFANRVRDSFRKYTVGNPALTISGGIAIVEKKFPIYQAAIQAGEAEEAAKCYRSSKDAISFMGFVTDWETFNEAEKEASDLECRIRTNRLPRSLLQTLLNLYFEIQQAQVEAKRNHQRAPRFGRWSWMAAYQLTRLAHTLKSEEDKKYINKLRDKFLNPDETINILGLAARWAQYLTRGG